MGKQLFGQNISISDDVYHPLQTGPAVRWRGMPRQRVCCDRGIPIKLFYSRAAAKAAGKQPTGTVLPCRNEYGEAPMNLVFGAEIVDKKMSPPPNGGCS